MKRHRIVPFLVLVLYFSCGCQAQDDFDGSGDFGSASTDEPETDSFVTPTVDVGSAEPATSFDSSTVVPDTDDEDILAAASRTSRRTTYRPAPTSVVDIDDGSAEESGDDFIDVDEETTVLPTTSTTRTVSITTSSTTSTTEGDIDIDSGVSETMKPTEQPNGPCERKYLFSAQKKKWCDEDGYFSELVCQGNKCKCYNKYSGDRDKSRKAHHNNCVSKTDTGHVEHGEKPGDDDKYDIEKPDDPQSEPAPRHDGNMLTENPGMFAGIIGGAVVGLLLLILLVMFIVYRMRKKDEGSYKVDNPKKPPTHPYKRCPQEFYA